MSSPNSIIEAFTHAFNAAKLYGVEHPACRQAIGETASAAMRLASAARFTVGGRGLMHDGKLLEPSGLYDGLAKRLREAGIAEMEIHRSLDQTGASRAVKMLCESGAADGAAMSGSEAFAASMNQATGRAIRLHGLRVGGVLPISRAGTTSNEPSRSGAALHDLAAIARSAGASGISQSVSEALEVLMRKQDASAASDEIGDSPAVADDAAALTCLNAAIGSLSESEQAKVTQMLAGNQTIPFEEATSILSRLPVLNLADAISVLGRSDGRFNATSLMLLRRLANLSIGNEADLQRLSRIADSWASETEGGGGVAADARHAASLLKRVAESDFRSSEYTAQLQQLLAAESQADQGAADRVKDDFALLARRAVEIACDTLTGFDSGMSDEDRAATFEFLGARCAVLTERGDLATFGQVRQLAKRTAERSDSPAAAAVAKRLLVVSDASHSMATALGRCGDAEAVAAHLREAHAAGADAAASLAVRAASCSRSPAQLQAVLKAASGLDRQAMLEEARKLVEADRRCAASLCPLIQAISPADVFDILKPALLGHETEARESAYAALARTHITWPAELCVRGLSEESEAIRMLAAGQAARDASANISLLIDRLIGRIGPSIVPASERKRLQELILRIAGPATTRRIAWPLLVSSWTPGGQDAAESLLPLLNGRRTTLSVKAALLARRLSPFRYSKMRKEAA